MHYKGLLPTRVCDCACDVAKEMGSTHFHGTIYTQRNQNTQTLSVNKDEHNNASNKVWCHFKSNIKTAGLKILFTNLQKLNKEYPNLLQVPQYSHSDLWCTVFLHICKVLKWHGYYRTDIDSTNMDKNLTRDYGTWGRCNNAEYHSIQAWGKLSRPNWFKHLLVHLSY